MNRRQSPTKCSTFITDTKGSSIFKDVKDHFEEKEILLTNLSARATDDAPAMSRYNACFLAHVRKEVPEIITVHCIILLRLLHDIPQLVFGAVNAIKVCSINDGPFRHFAMKMIKNSNSCFYIWQKGGSLCRFS